MPSALLKSLFFRYGEPALERRGLKVVKWPRPAPPPAPHPGGVPEHFPVGRVGPWAVPADLRARAAAEAWVRVLLGVYDDPASWPSSIVPEGGMLLHALVRNIGPTTVVETGTCLGVSTVWMASALAALGAGRVVTFDDYRAAPDGRLASSPLFQDRLAGVRARIGAAGLGAYVDVRAGDSVAGVTAARGELAAAGGVQLAFIDGDHSPGGAVADFRAVEPVLAVGGYVIVHDVFPHVANHLGPRELVDHIDRHARGRYQACDLYTAQTNYGMTVMRRVG